MSIRSSFSRKEFLHSILGSGKNSGYINLELDGTTDFLSGLTCFSDTDSSEDCWTSGSGTLLDDLDTWNTAEKIFINLDRVFKNYECYEYYLVQNHTEICESLNFLATY
jgi:hypothetical protein